MNDLIVSHHITTGWVEHLALEELNMEESGVIHLDEHINPIHFLEESSIKFMDQIKELFELYASKFNEYRGTKTTGQQIKIFKISNTVNDFILFRNSLRLIVSRKASDVINIGFLMSSGEIFPARIHGNAPISKSPHEIKAHIGPFNKITWRFNGEIVDQEAMVKYYLTEFIRKSAK